MKNTSLEVATRLRPREGQQAETGPQRPPSHGTLDRVQAKVMGLRQSVQAPGLWYDIAAVDRRTADTMVSRLLETVYSGLIVPLEQIETYAAPRYARLDRIVQVDDADRWANTTTPQHEALRSMSAIVASGDEAVLDAAQALGFKTCLRIAIADADDLARAIFDGRRRDHVALRFADPTNIPLELVVAEFQATRTAVLKEVVAPDGPDAVVAALGTMEVGADGVVFSPRTAAQLADALPQIQRAASPSLTIEPAIVESSRPIGMGHRACIDLVTLFEPTEGMLIGSTSQGGILCCAEVFHLPYMAKRPFRINAGGVHAYLFTPGNRTHYLSELRTGQPALVVQANGETRIAAIGRIKIEVRPLRLITCRFAGGEQIGVIMQDDWHVRVFGADAKPRNITELRPGDEVLSHRATPGRHVGIPVSEFIREV